MPQANRLHVSTTEESILSDSFLSYSPFGDTQSGPGTGMRVSVNSKEEDFWHAEVTHCVASSSSDSCGMPEVTDTIEYFVIRRLRAELDAFGGVFPSSSLGGSDAAAMRAVQMRPREEVLHSGKVTVQLWLVPTNYECADQELPEVSEIKITYQPREVAVGAIAEALYTADYTRVNAVLALAEAIVLLVISEVEGHLLKPALDSCVGVANQRKASKPTPSPMQVAMTAWEIVDRAVAGDGSVDDAIEALKELQGNGPDTLQGRALRRSLCATESWEVRAINKQFYGPVLAWVLQPPNLKPDGIKGPDRLKLLRSLLELRADPNGRYIMRPCGKKHAEGRFPVIFAAKDQSYTRALLEARADVNAVAFLNGHVHSTLLWDACWRQDEDLVDLLLTAGAAIDCPAGWLVDEPPPHPSCRSVTKGATPTRRTVLELASMRGMKIAAKRLIENGASVTETALKAVMRWRLEQKHIAVVLKKPQALFNLLMKADFRGFHPQSLHRICATLAELDTEKELVKHLVLRDYISEEESLQALQRFSTQALTPPRLMTTISKTSHWEMSLQPLWAVVPSSSEDAHVTIPRTVALAALISHAPSAAAILIDHIFLQEPKVESLNRNPMPSLAVIRHEDMCTVRSSDARWTYTNGKAPAWQNELVYGRSEVTEGSDDYLSAPMKKGSQFCDIQVLCAKGIVRLEVLMAIESLGQDRMGELFSESVALRAIVYHVWFTWVRVQHYIGLSIAILQLGSMLVWAYCVLAEEKPSEFVPRLCWAVFTTSMLDTVFGDGFYAMGIACLSFKPFRVMNKKARFLHLARPRRLLGWLVNGLTVYISIDGLVRGGMWNMTPGDSLAISVMQALSWCTIINHLEAIGGLGQMLVAIHGAMLVSRMWAMILVLAFFLSAFLTFTLLEWSEDGVTNLLVRVGSTMILGEPELVGVGAGRTTDGMRSSVTFLCFFAFAVYFMNIFIAMAERSYHEESKKAYGTFWAVRSSRCARVFVHRAMLVGAAKCCINPELGLGRALANLCSRWSPVRSVLVAVFLATVVGAHAVLTVGIAEPTSGHLLAWCCAALLAARLHFVLVPFPFTEPKFLWLCTPAKNAGSERPYTADAETAADRRTASLVERLERAVAAAEAKSQGVVDATPESPRCHTSRHSARKPAVVLHSRSLRSDVSLAPLVPKQHIWDMPSKSFSKLSVEAPIELRCSVMPDTLTAAAVPAQQPFAAELPKLAEALAPQGAPAELSAARPLAGQPPVASSGVCSLDPSAQLAAGRPLVEEPHGVPPRGGPGDMTAQLPTERPLAVLPGIYPPSVLPVGIPPTEEPTLLW